jgi:formylglycine-generating enzyme required for sulfatase activity
MMMKKIDGTITILILAAAMIVLAACANMLEPPRANRDERTGTVYIAIDGNSAAARTLAPDPVNFTRYTASFSGPASQDELEITGEGASVNLAPGEWEITVTAFAGTAAAAGRGSAEVTVESDQTVTADITIVPIIESGRNGTLRYSVSIPSVDSATLSLVNMTSNTAASGTPVNLKDAADSSGGVAANTLNLAAGYYLMTISLIQGGKYAGRTEVVHIYGGLETAAEYAFTEVDFWLGLSLADGVWHDGNMAVSGADYYRFPVTAGASYAVYWNDKYSGPGKTLDIGISAYYENDGASIFSGDNGGYDTPVSFIAASDGNVIIRVVSSGVGTYAVLYSEIIPLSNGAAETGAITAGGVKLYSFLANANMAYEVSWEDSGDQAGSSYTGDITVTAYRGSIGPSYILSNCNAVDSGYATPQTVNSSLYNSATIYLKVAGVTGGTYSVKSVTAVVTGPTYREMLLATPDAVDPVTITGSSAYYYNTVYDWNKGVFIPGRTVILSPFQIAKYETTYELWHTVKQWAAANGYTFANAGREGNNGTIGAAPTAAAKYEPVTYISWRDAVIWCNAYSEMSGKTPVYRNGSNTALRDSTASVESLVDITKWAGKDGYRLPTEAEWEYAARGGGTPSTTGSFAYRWAGTNAASALGNYVWHYSNSGGSTHAVGEKTANGLGLHDMSGNVEEWCWDWYGTVGTGTMTGPTGPASGTDRVARGGAWYYTTTTDYYAVAYRNCNIPSYRAYDVGFRVVCSTSVSTVNTVTVSPATASVDKGGTQTFAATVTGTGSPAQTVTWAVSGNNSTGTVINADGLLAVAANETATSLTVTAASTVDTTKYGTAAITVTVPVTVNTVTVSPATASVDKGGTHTFTATVAGTGSPAQTVTWTVAGGVTGTAISADGLLAVAANETATSLTVTAASMVDTTKYGTAVITVTVPATVEAEAFKTTYSAILAQTVGNIAASDEAAVDDALSAYNSLSPAIQALLTGEKTLLDKQKAKIEELKAGQAAAEAFKTAHSAILAKTVGNIAASDEAAVDDALGAYNDLSSAAQALLIGEKTLLDKQKAKIEELKAGQAAAEAFKTIHSAILAKTVGNTAASDEAAVDDALGAYNDLSSAAQALLTGEKALLDKQKAKIEELKAGQAAAEAFKTTHSAILAKMVGNIATSDEAAVDDALGAYNDLSSAAQALLTGEKALLDSLKAKIDTLGTGSITLIYPTDAADNALSGGSLTIFGTQTHTLTVNGIFDSYRWRVDGSVKGSGKALALKAADYAPGIHQLSLEVTLNSAVYSKSGAFTVQ